MKKKKTNDEPCFGCKGSGEQSIQVVTVNKGSTISTIKCIHCNGGGRLPAGSEAAYHQAFEEFWCKGEGACASEDALSHTTFHDDGECAECEKHHYHCGVCGKISQVG